jgi:hypothetical protein
MKISKLFFAGTLAGILVLSGCGTKAVQPVNSGSGSGQTAESSSSSCQSAESAVRETESRPSEPSAVQSEAPRSSAAQSKAPAPSASSGVTPASSGPAPSAESKNYDNGVETSTDGTWEAYDSNRDDYKLHIRKKGAASDKVIVNDPVLCPCLVGNWVYYFNTLCEIDKVRLDGSGKTKVCGTDDFKNVSGSTAITAEYKEGYIRYKTVQMRCVGDTSSYPPYYYKLDVASGKVTAVKN